MQFTQLGRSRLRVSRICLGTMLFGSTCDEALSRRLLDEAADVGVNFVDLADRYPTPPKLEYMGRTEEIVGRWLRDSGAPFVVATKFGRPTGLDPSSSGGSRKHVMEACEASLKRLGLDRIDLYWMHVPDSATPLEETFSALKDLVEQGKVLYVGVSNFDARELADAIEVAREADVPLVAIQPRYNLLNRAPESDLIPLAIEAGISVVPYNPLAAGMLTGRYRRGEKPPDGSRFSAAGLEIDRRFYLSEAAFDIAEVLEDVAKIERVSSAQAAIAWLISQPGITSAIVGCSRPGQLRELAPAAELRLSKASTYRLDSSGRRF